MKTTSSLLIFFCFCAFYANANFIYFEIEDTNQNYSILNLESSAKAKKVIRDNAYLSFKSLDNNKKYSNCWLDFIKNKKITISSSGNSFYFVSQVNKKYLFKLDFDPSKIKILNVDHNKFLEFCENQGYL
tara:strand:+ start:984 stop:1373 length:390 start_codon:yes stop_codon:yes gene_type:complete